MTRPDLLRASASALPLLFVPALAIAAPQTGDGIAVRRHADHVLGTSLSFTALAPNEAAAEIAYQAARAEIARLDTILSVWRTDSEISALNASSAMQVSPDLFAVVSAAEKWRVRTGGAFDARLGLIETAWRESAARGQAPDSAMLRDLTTAIAANNLTLDTRTRTITRPAALRLAPDAIAKGYVIDAALAAARRAAPNVDGLMLDIGGDVRSWGRAPDGDAWRIGIADPAQLADNAAPAMIAALRGKALAFSGRGPRDLIIGDRAYGHIFAGAQPASHIQGAAVIAGKAADADALATALMATPADKGLALINALPGVEALLFTAGGDRLMSSGWADQLARETALTDDLYCQTGDAPASGAAWPTGYALDIQYEVPKIAVSDYRKPYVLIWITDSDRKLVRTLLVLGEKEQWQDDNYVWWRRYGRHIPGLVDAKGRPTKSPGKHNVTWDGLDDQGKPVAQGRYIIHIEAAREHGGHSYGSTEITLGADAATANIASAAELGALSASYGVKK